MGNICLQPRPSTLLGDINKAKNAGTGKGKKGQRDDTPQVEITPPPPAPAPQPARSPTPPPKPSIPAKTEEKKNQPDPGPSAPSAVSASTDPSIDDLTASYRNDDLVVQRAAQKVKVLEQMFDADRDHGYMDKDRLRFMLEKLKIMDKDVHNYLLKRYDQDYNGKVDFQEFCAMMLDVIDIKKSFEKADLDRNGSISRDEIGLVLNRFGITLEGHTITLLIDLFDNNRNGAVDFAEFFPMSFYLQELIKEYENFKTRKSGDTEWLRPLLGTHPNEEDAVAKQLRSLVSDNNFPTMDEFARVIISAANSDRGQNFSTIKAPYILKVRTKAHPSTKPKQIAREPSQSGNTERPAFSGLFEDPDFVPSKDLLPQSKKPKEIVWKRISEINPDKHELFVDGVEEGDVIQGSLGDCWFLGALAVVAASANEYIKDMFEIEMPEQGYYRVKFFKDGKWVSVEIDDRLPCYLSKGGSLILYCASCRDESEFWVPLVEKAYAKLHGSYTALEGGNICDALKDLTGGAIEILRWKESESEGIWNKIRALSKDHSLMGCSIDSSAAAESKTGGGLLVNHAYSILKCKEVDGVRFVRIRNPWGEGEWNGDWSDQSPLWDDEWKSKKFAKKYKFEDDGTFFMSFEDFVSYFNRIYVMRSSYKEAKSIQKGEWKKGLTSFGCKNNPFWLSNPQYAIKTEERNTKVFVNLSQPDLRYSLKKNPEEYRSMQREYESVGLYILRTTEPRFKKMVYHDEDKKGSTAFTDMRDISFEFECEVPGTYILLPCTYHADKEASYFVSFYSKEPFEVLELPPKKSSTLNGEWSGSSAGGCSNYRATWMNNPQFLLKCSASDSIDIILAQSNAKGLQPIGIYVFAAFSDERMSKPSRVIEKPSGMPDEASVSATVHIDANESYIIMPATLDPAEGNFALTVISENITTFRLL